MSALLSAQGLVAHYRKLDGGWVRAVDQVSLELKEGEVLGIAGESGCGKSTLASVLSLNVRAPLWVRGGTLEIAGESMPITATNAALPERRGTIVSLLPQGAMNSLNPTQRVRDFIFDVLSSHMAEITRKEAVEVARARIEQLSLPPRVLDAYPHQLSGGMKQRVVAVISTLLNPKVLVADEPTSALDVSSQRALLALLKRLLADGIIGSIILVTHELPVLRQIADRVMIMYAGQLSEIGPSETVIFDPAHPYTQALMNATIVLESATKRARIHDFEGAPPDLTNPPTGCRFHPRCPLATPRCSAQQPPLVALSEDHDAWCWAVADAVAARAGVGKGQA